MKVALLKKCELKVGYETAVLMKVSEPVYNSLNVLANWFKPLYLVRHVCFNLQYFVRATVHKLRRDQQISNGFYYLTSFQSR